MLVDSYITGKKDAVNILKQRKAVLPALFCIKQFVVCSSCLVNRIYLLSLVLLEQGGYLYICPA